MTRRSKENLRNALLFTMAVAITALAPPAQAKDDDAVKAITRIENDAVKADLANDKAFFEKIWTKDFVSGTSFGEWETRDAILKDLGDTQNNKTNSEKIDDLKVQVHGNTAIARYKLTYDAVVRGEPRARTVLVTDTFVKEKDGWKLVAAHASEAKK